MLRPGVISVVLHLLVMAVIIWGLPWTLRDRVELQPMISVEVIDIGSLTRVPKIKKAPAPRPEPEKPTPKEDPLPTPPPPADEPEPEPEVAEETLGSKQTTPATQEPQPTHEPVPSQDTKTDKEPLKVEEKKPEPKLKEETKEKPKKDDNKDKKKKEDKKEDKKAKEEDPFDSLIKNLENDKKLSKNDKKKKSDDKNKKKKKEKSDDLSDIFDAVEKSVPKKKESEHGPEEDGVDAQNVELGDTLSISEMDAVRNKLRPCWNYQPGLARDLVVEIRAVMNPDGTVQSAQILDQARMANDPAFRAAAEIAYRALMNPQCSPLPLPADKYERWRTMILPFEPQDMF